MKPWRRSGFKERRACGVNKIKEKKPNRLELKENGPKVLLQKWRSAAKEGDAKTMGSAIIAALEYQKSKGPLGALRWKVFSKELDQEKPEMMSRAVLKGLAHVVEALLKNGAQADLVHWQRTPMAHAASVGSIEAMRALRAGGASVNMGAGEGSDIGDLCSTQTDSWGETALIVAVYHNKIEAARWLLAQGADVNKADARGLGPLHWAAMAAHVEMARLLIAEGADMGAKTKKGQTTGQTPLMRAAIKGWSLPALALLIAEGGSGSLQEVDDSGDTAAHCACDAPQSGALELLIEAGCDPYVKNKQGKTCFDLAKSRGWDGAFVARVEQRVLAKWLEAERFNGSLAPKLRL